MLTAGELAAVDALVAGVLAGHTRALARALSLVEDEARGSAEVCAACSAASPAPPLKVGFTGPPGVGKSTLIEALLRHLRGAGHRVGVLATDPSSPISGGTLLGDRIRMGRHHDDAGVFIRSMATRGHLGGLPARAAECAALLGAAGFDVVLLETVGVGQNEVAVGSLADVSVLVLQPGMGDGVQAMKAGVMEIANIFAINKCDLDGAECLLNDILDVQLLAQRPRSTIVKVEALAGTGVGELWEAVQACSTTHMPREAAHRC